MDSYISHFSTLQPPLSPNQEEVKMYEEFCEGKVLLLGYTKELMHLASAAVDLNPPENTSENISENTFENTSDPKIKKGDWFHINERFDTIIGDGVLNLVGGDLIDHLKTLSNRICIRFFTERIDTMKYATIFSSNLKIMLPTSITPTQDKCVMLKWNFGS